MLGRSSRLDRAAIAINITAITMTATVATATAVCFSNIVFDVEDSCFSGDLVVVVVRVVDDGVVDDDVVDNVVVSGVVV